MKVVSDNAETSWGRRKWIHGRRTAPLCDTAVFTWISVGLKFTSVQEFESTLLQLVKKLNNSSN